MNQCGNQQKPKSEELWQRLAALKVSANQKPLGSMEERVAALERRFWGKVNKREGCWEWTGTLHKSGYGGTCAGKSRTGKNGTITTHRLSWLLTFGDIPDKLFVLHKCDNKKCVRPDHLFLGTQKDNMGDAARKGLLSKPTRKSTKLKKEQILEIRANKDRLSNKELALKFNTSAPNIYHILKGETWKTIL